MGNKSIGDYFAGGALTLGLIILVSEALKAFAGNQNEAILSTLANIYIITHLVGGFLGGYLVTRRTKGIDYLQNGTVVAVLVYILESFYNLFFPNPMMDLWVFINLLIGCVVGSTFYRIRIDRMKLLSNRVKDKHKT